MTGNGDDTKPQTPPGWVRLTHPTTGKFVAEYHPHRGILLVVDNRGTAYIDLTRIRYEEIGDSAELDDTLIQTGTGRT